MFNSYVKVPEGISNIYHGSQDPCLLLNHPKGDCLQNTHQCANLTPTFFASKTNEANIFGVGLVTIQLQIH